MLLIQPRWGRISRFPSRPPLGLAYIAGALKRAGYDSHIVDMQTDDTGVEGFITSHSPRLIGFSVTTWTYKQVLEKAKRLKRCFPHLILVAGGPHATALPGQMLDEGFDVVTASRFQKGGGQSGVGLYRAIISYCAQIFMKFVFGLWGQKEFSCGFRAYRASIIQRAIKRLLENQGVIGKIEVDHMTKQNEVYKCNVCGNIVEVVHASFGTLVCCGQPMELVNEKTEDVGLEKHVPVVEKTDTGIRVKVGSVPHPMEDKHYIEWIQIIADGKLYRTFLEPGNKPQAEFEINAKQISAREYCNVHGLWKS